MTDNEYKKYYNCLSKSFKDWAGEEKEKLKESGIKFTYKACFEEMKKILNDKKLTVKQAADRLGIYKEKYIKNYIREHIRKLKERSNRENNSDD